MNRRKLKGRAQALFPRVEVTLKTADALLILEAGQLQNHGGAKTNPRLVPWNFTGGRWSAAAT